jgi:Helix-turn-helix.
MHLYRLSELGGFMKTIKKSEFIPAKPHAKLTTGEVIRMLRDLKGWTQAELANRCGITATNISLLENDKVEIGKKRVEQIAKAFDVHPAIIMFPEYEGKEIQKAA